MDKSAVMRIPQNIWSATSKAWQATQSINSDKKFFTIVKAVASVQLWRSKLHVSAACGKHWTIKQCSLQLESAPRSR